MRQTGTPVFPTAFFQTACDSCAGDKPEQSTTAQEKCDSRRLEIGDSSVKLTSNVYNGHPRNTQPYTNAAYKLRVRYLTSRYHTAYPHPKSRSFFPIQIISTLTPAYRLDNIPPHNPRSHASFLRKLAQLRQPIRGSPPTRKPPVCSAKGEPGGSPRQSRI